MFLTSIEKCKTPAPDSVDGDAESKESKLVIVDDAELERTKMLCDKFTTASEQLASMVEALAGPEPATCNHLLAYLQSEELNQIATIDVCREITDELVGLVSGFIKLYLAAVAALLQSPERIHVPVEPILFNAVNFMTPNKSSIWIYANTHLGVLMEDDDASMPLEAAKVAVQYAKFSNANRFDYSGCVVASINHFGRVGGFETVLKLLQRAQIVFKPVVLPSGSTRIAEGKQPVSVRALRYLLRMFTVPCILLMRGGVIDGTVRRTLFEAALQALKITTVTGLKRFDAIEWNASCELLFDMDAMLTGSTKDLVEMMKLGQVETLLSSSMLQPRLSGVKLLIDLIKQTELRDRSLARYRLTGQSHWLKSEFLAPWLIEMQAIDTIIYGAAGKGVEHDEYGIKSDLSCLNPEALHSEMIRQSVNVLVYMSKQNVSASLICYAISLLS